MEITLEPFLTVDNGTKGIESNSQLRTNKQWPAKLDLREGLGYISVSSKITMKVTSSIPASSHRYRKACRLYYRMLEPLVRFLRGSAMIYMFRFRFLGASSCSVKGIPLHVTGGKA